MKFYVVHTYTGREKRVKELVEKAIERLNQPGLFGRVIMPAEKVARVRKSKIVAEERRLYPGYIVVEKSFRGRRPYTAMRLTPKGRKAFQRYLGMLRQIVDRGDRAAEDSL